MRPVIDGERKAVCHRVSPTSFEYAGLFVRSDWEQMSAEPGTLILTQRAFMGAMLHDQSLKRQYPSVGHVFPAKLLAKRSGIKRSGKAMDSHLSAIADQRKAEREYARILQNARKVVL